MAPSRLTCCCTISLPALSRYAEERGSSQHVSHTGLHAGHGRQAVRSRLTLAVVHMQEETDRVAAMSPEERRKHKQQQRKEAAKAKKREEEVAEREAAAAADSAAAKDKAGKKPAASKRSVGGWVFSNRNLPLQHLQDALRTAKP